MLALGFLIGVPAIVALTLTSKGSGTRLKYGPQPGGTLSGFVLADDGVKALSGIRVALLGLDERGERAPLCESRTTADGRFEIAAPTFNGIYEVVAGSDAWRASAEPASFLGWDGHARAVDPLRFKLAPGSELLVELKRRDGRAVGNGKWTLSMRKPGAFLMVGVWDEVARGALENGALRVEALPNGKARVVVRLASGEKVDIETDLVLGAQKQTVEI